MTGSLRVRLRYKFFSVSGQELGQGDGRKGFSASTTCRKPTSGSFPTCRGSSIALIHWDSSEGQPPETRLATYQTSTLSDQDLTYSWAAAQGAHWTEGPSRRLVSAQLNSQTPSKRYARPGVAGPFPLFTSAIQTFPAHVRSPPVQPSRPRVLPPRVPR